MQQPAHHTREQPTHHTMQQPAHHTMAPARHTTLRSSLSEAQLEYTGQQQKLLLPHTCL